MSGTTAAATPPATKPPAVAALLDANGNASQSWLTYFAALGAQAAAAGAIPAVGDYRATAIADLGPNWLLCNGQSFPISQYPALGALLAPTAAPSATFPVPNIAPLKDPNDSNTTLQATFVRAL